jgi:hypothetical protein
MFIPSGIKLRSTVLNNVYESIYYYDDVDHANRGDCSISNTNEGKFCQVSFQLSEDVDGPLYVYYQLRKYYQNHRRYFKSISYPQLLGLRLSESDVQLACSPLLKNGSTLLNPCGLVANSFFNDIITFDNTNTQLSMDENKIALTIDRNDLFKQVDGFQFREVASCDVPCAGVDLPTTCNCYYESKTNTTYRYYYPDDDTVQYLYESYPDIISPIDGVTNQHFMVWMRISSLPTFRKLYGVIGGDDTKLQAGTILTFNITNNFEVNSFGGSKALVLSTVGEYGGKNTFIGISFYVSGILMMVIGSVYAAVDYFL